MKRAIMKDRIYKKPKTRQEELRDFYRNILIFVGVFILFRLITNPGRRSFFWVSIVWGIIVVLYALKVFVFKDKFAGKKLEEKEEIMENESKSE
jgi:uncharacterized protein YhhL (DUF1145 family)